MKFNQAQLAQIKKYRVQGLTYAKIADKLKLPRKLFYYYNNKARYPSYHCRKVGRPKSSSPSPHKEYKGLINSLPSGSYYKSLLIKQLERNKESKL